LLSLAKLAEVPFRNKDVLLVWGGFLQLIVAEVEDVRHEVTVRELEAFVAQLVKVRVREGFDWLDSLLWLVN